MLLMQKITKETNTMTCWPLTKTGAIIVNGSPLSCFAQTTHWFGKLGLMPITHGLISSEYLQNYTNKITDIHYAFPKCIRRHLPVYL